MIEKYTATIGHQEKKAQPSEGVINRLLNYSKALEVRELKKHKILINLN